MRVIYTPEPLWSREDILVKLRCTSRHYTQWHLRLQQLSYKYSLLSVVSIQALTGGSTEVSTLDGRKIRVPINEIVRYVRSIFRLKFKPRKKATLIKPIHLTCIGLCNCIIERL